MLGFDGKPFKSVTQGAADLDAIEAEGQEDAEPEADASELGTLIALIKQTLGDDVSDVRKSDRLTDSATCLVRTQARSTAIWKRCSPSTIPMAFRPRRPILEINPRHEMVKSLAQAAKAGGVNETLEDAARLLLDQAHILEGDPVSDPAAFAARLSRVMTRGMSA